MDSVCLSICPSSSPQSGDERGHGVGIGSFQSHREGRQCKTSPSGAGTISAVVDNCGAWPAPRWGPRRQWGSEEFIGGAESSFWGADGAGSSGSGPGMMC